MKPIQSTITPGVPAYSAAACRESWDAPGVFILKGGRYGNDLQERQNILDKVLLQW